MGVKDVFIWETFIGLIGFGTFLSLSDDKQMKLVKISEEERERRAHKERELELRRKREKAAIEREKIPLKRRLTGYVQPGERL